jgi:hypothetical protein
VPKRGMPVNQASRPKLRGILGSTIEANSLGVESCDTLQFAKNATLGDLALKTPWGSLVEEV